MKQRSIAMLMPVLALIAATPPAQAQTRGPVCREASVVDEMAREIRALDHYTTVDATLVTEQPTIDPNIVRCQVCVQSAPYNSLRFGDRPVERCIAHNFEVHILPSGFVVQDLR